VPKTPPTPQTPGSLHLVIPASRADVNLCKTILSAAVLGYPAPTLLNWDVAFDDPNLVEGGSHLGKISGFLSYLEEFPPSRDQDLVLMVDGYDIWFQLPPNVLLERYYAVNEVADRRSKQAYGTAATTYNFTQRSIISCQKRCWPWTLEDPPCAAVPQSTLPDDVYGENTDTYLDNDRDRFSKIRQRFLNSGFTLGTVESLKALFRHAKARMETDKNFGSDQHILSYLFGQQEAERQPFRVSTGPVNRLLGAVKPTSAVDAPPEPVMQFGLGLDYGSSLSLATVFAEDDTEWLQFDNGTTLEDARSARKIPHKGKSVQGLQSDIEQSRPPFSTSTTEDLPRNQSWSSSPLLTNLWTGITPAIIHHNAHRDGLKALREQWWDRTWYFPHARALLDARQRQPSGPVAFAGGRYWWPSQHGAGLSRVWKDDAWRMISYNAICSNWDLEVFRDLEKLDGESVEGS